MHYNYFCSMCKSEYSSNDIEKKLKYLCPQCGSSIKNQPLKGVLEIIYDYNYIKQKISKKEFLNNKIGQFWVYPYLWPLAYSEYGLEKVNKTRLEKLALNSTPISEIEFEKSIIYLFDDSRNPTLSYKDRASTLVAIKAIQMGINEISAASTGNAGSSLAGICARLGLKSHVFVPKNIPASKRIQVQSFGANIYIVDGDYDLAFDLCLEISLKKNWFNRNTAYNPLTIEGKKSAAYDMFISLKGELPENIFVPVGDGVIISGIYKGFIELLKLGWIDKVPKLIAVQAEGSDAVIKFMKTRKFEYQNANTIADSISAGAPRNLYKASEAIRNSSGIGVSVSDQEIISAQKILTQKYGILAEPAAAATLAGFIKLKSENVNLQNSLLMITGNGLKDISSLESWNKIPLIKSYSDWKFEFSK